MHILRRLGEAIEAARPPCDVYTDSMCVRIDSTTVYEPDVLVRCGKRLDHDAVEVTDPRASLTNFRIGTLE